MGVKKRRCTNFSYKETKLLLSLISNYKDIIQCPKTDAVSMERESRCPGSYCGRYELPDGNISACGSCPRGSRVNHLYMCIPCTNTLVFYDWLYLIFMTVVPVVIHLKKTDMRSTPVPGNVSWSIYLSSVLETAISATLTILLVEPFGRFQVTSCNVQWVSDWYTLFYNPAPYYEDTLYCTQEAVYPLYSIIFVLYGLNIIILFVFRLSLLAYFSDLDVICRSLYTGLYTFPICAVIHAIFGGVIYYVFPYITLMVSMIMNAYHYAVLLDRIMTKTMLQLVKDSVNNLRSIAIILGVWICNSFAVVGITQLTEFKHYLLLLTAPLPTIFCVLTSKFTDPNRFHNEL